MTLTPTRQKVDRPEMRKPVNGFGERIERITQAINIRSIRS